MRKTKVRQGILLGLIVVMLFLIIAVIVMTGRKKQESVKIGLILTGTTEEPGWNNAHYQGVKYACEKLGAELLVKENVPENEKHCVAAVSELAEDGVSMILLSSYAYPVLAKSAIERYPEISFYGISSELSLDNMTSYFGRMYQARYLAGMVAGMKTESNCIGYVAAMPNNEVNRGINAFTLGVRKANPEAVVNVIWTGSWDDEDKEAAATKQLIEEANADVITYHQNRHTVAETADAAGVYSIGYNEETEGLSERYLTAAVWNWNTLYASIVREVLKGEANSVKRHWFGIDTGVVGLAELSTEVEREIADKIKETEKELSEGRHVFSGVIYDNNGEQRCYDGESIGDNILLEKMDWYVEGVYICD